MEMGIVVCVDLRFVSASLVLVVYLLTLSLSLLLVVYYYYYYYDINQSPCLLLLPPEYSVLEWRMRKDRALL